MVHRTLPDRAAFRRLTIGLLLCSLATSGCFLRQVVAEDTAAQDLWEAYGSVEPRSDGETESLDDALSADGAVDVPILMYHRVVPRQPGETPIQRRYTVEPGILDMQLDYLQGHGYTVVSLGQLADHLLDGMPLPRKPVVLTFDDGWAGQFTYALPVLKKHGVTATFFVTTDFLGHRGFMSWAQLRELDDGGMTVASHTRTHPFLTKLSDENLRAEIAGSKRTLENFLGKPVPYFAYPFGDKNRRAMDAVAAAGYRAARGTDDGRTQNRDRIYRLKCFEIHDSLSEFSDLLFE
jgi:peptidoglycan/xylan/chitin deacetylase (PgdA/CDA1 family)